MKMLALLSMLALSACASFDSPLYVRGNVAATTHDPQVISRLQAVSATLHTPEMNKAIADAKPGVPRK